MPYFHRTEIMGALAQTPQLGFTEQGNGRTHFGVFVNEFYRSQATNERIQKAIVYNCVAFGPIAEQCAKVLEKGTWVFIEGRMDPHKIEDGRTFWNLKVDRFIRLDGRRQSDEAKEESRNG